MARLTIASSRAHVRRRARGRRASTRVDATASARAVAAFTSRALKLARLDVFARENARAMRVGELAIVLAFAGCADAGYSGDWSRVGALTLEGEGVARACANAIACAHVACACASMNVANERGTNEVLAFAKGLAFGVVGVADVAFAGDARAIEDE